MTPRKKSALSQFRDPWGLMWRMLRSGDSAAYWALFQQAAGLLLIPLDLLGVPFDRRLARSARSADLPLIILIGPPRSGSTLVYQVLSRHLDVTYFTNLSALFPRSPLLYSYLTAALRWIPKERYRSFYGNTGGLSAPSDGFHIWNRWLGTNRYEVPNGISVAESNEMQEYLSAWALHAGKPLLNKNNRNSACVPLLSSGLTNSYFVEVSRDPLYVAQSLLIARKVVQGSEETGWGLSSQNVSDGASREAVVDEVCNQVQRILEVLKTARDSIPEDRILRVSYEDLCARPSDVVRQVSQAIPGVAVRSESRLDDLEPMRVSNRRRVSRREFEQIRRRLGRGDQAP